MVSGMGVYSLRWSGSSWRLPFVKYRQEIVLNELANPVKCSGVFITVLSDSSSVSLFSKYHNLDDAHYPIHRAFYRDKIQNNAMLY